MSAPTPAPDRGPAVTWGRAVAVRGGPRGEAAELAELVAAASALDDAGDALRRAVGTARRVTALVEVCAERSPGTAPRAAAACAPLLSTASGAVAAVHDADRTAADVRTAVRGYAAAESAAGRVVRGIQVGAGHALGTSGPVGWVLAAAGGLTLAAVAAQRVVTLRLLRRTPTATGVTLNALSRWTRTLEGPAGLVGWVLVGEGPPPPDPRQTGVLEPVLPFVGGFLRGALPGGAPGPVVVAGTASGQVPVAAGTAEELWGWVGVARWLTGTVPSGLVVARSLTRPPGPAQAPPRGIPDLVAGIERTYPAPPGDPGAAGPGGGPPGQPPAPAGSAGAGAGTIEVKELRRPDGTRTWVVTVPGTQEWGPVQGPNPFDLTSNLGLVARGADDVTAAVVRAMELAGIRPGEPVVLTGHSQGGIAAAAVAAAPALQERFDVRAVVTAGSPVGTIDLPPDVVGVHLEHATDLVAGCDAAPNPDTPTRTTAVVDLGAAPDAATRAAAASPLASHQVRTYARTAAGLEGAGDPRWDAASAQVAALLADTTTVGTAWYSAVRVPPPSPGARG